MDSYKFEVTNLQKNSIIVVKFNKEYVAVDTVAETIEYLSEKFPNNVIVALPDSLSIETFSKERLKEWYEMIGGILDNID